MDPLAYSSHSNFPVNQVQLRSSLCQHCGNSFVAFNPGSDLYCCQGCEQLAQLQLPKTSGAFLDSKEFRNLYAPHDHFDLYISGIHCASCVQILESLPEFVPGVLSSRLHFGESWLEIELAPQTPLSLVIRQIEKMGYKAHPLKSLNGLKNSRIQERRQDLIRLAVAAFCTTNLMLLSISIYAGLTGEMATWFLGLQTLLFLPILTFVAWPFYQGTWRSLGFGKVNIDLPITVALLLSTGLSFLSLWQHHDEVYFDSTASFLFLILISRFWQKSLQQKAESVSLFSELFTQPGVWKKVAALDWQYVPVENVEPGDLLRLSQGERLMVDGTLQSETALMDLSLLNGESMPRHFSKGMRVLAGCRAHQDQVFIKVEKVREQTELGLILNEVRRSQGQKADVLTRADRAAQVLILGVLGLAAVFFAIYQTVDPVEAFRRALALIVVACPCALALGAPLALAQGLRTALARGIFLKSGDVLDKASLIRGVAFDKTGTLTIGALSLQDLPLLSDELKSLILGLESDSHHPIANSLRRLWRNIVPVNFDNWAEIAGVGVHGEFRGAKYELRQDTENFSQGGPNSALYRNNKKLLSLKFGDELHPGAQKLIEQLQNRKLSISILSGDHTQATAHVANALGLSKAQILAQMTPQEKGQWLKAHPGTVMIGDGSNDLLGMNNSLFSIAVKGSVFETLKNADVYIAKDNLLLVLDLLTIAEETQKIVRRNLIYALSYNLLAGALALVGLIGPLGAAVLMPVSSVLIVGNSFWGTKTLRKMRLFK